MRRLWVGGGAAVLALAGCQGGAPTREQAEAQKKHGPATEEPTRVPPPDVRVNPPPPVVQPRPRGAAPAPAAATQTAAAPATMPKLPEPPPPVAAPDPGQPVGDAYRPAWWIKEPARAGGRVSVAAAAEGESLMEARSRVVGAGVAGLRAELKGAEPRNTQTVKTGVVRLASGQYRAFVLMSADE